MSRTAFEPAAETYVCLVTYRRDGREVRTPVWIAEAGDRYYVFSEGRAGKVKRIRATRRVRLAPCDFRGRIRRETWLEGEGRVVEDPETLRRAYVALRRKYGWQMKLGDWLARLSGRYGRRAMLELQLEPDLAGPPAR